MPGLWKSVEIELNYSANSHLIIKNLDLYLSSIGSIAVFNKINIDKLCFSLFLILINSIYYISSLFY